MLSLYTPQGGMPRRADTPCLLPDQKRAYVFVYLPFFFFSVAYIAYINATLMRGGPGGASSSSSSSSTARLGGSPRGAHLQPIRTNSAMDPPLTPTHLSVRRTPSQSNLGNLTPRSRPSSRPASPMLGPTSTFSFRDDEDTVITNASYYPSSPLALLPSALPYVSEPDQIEEGLLPPPSFPPSSPRLHPRSASMSSQNGNNTSGAGLKKWLKDGDKARHGWRRTASLMLDSMSLRLPQTGHPSSSAMGALASSMERIWLRVVKDLAQTAWPPLLVVSFIWWRLFSW